MKVKHGCEFPVLDNMVKTFQAYLSPQCHRKYSCIHCRAHLANHDELISKEHAFENSQKYKEGKFIIEMAHMIKDNGWD
ncbi:Protein yippee-like 2 [Acropora cervicornis]|uniref:Protein yippee-like 2 n=1 Tax=Acropora cervicornis TaxID=6130 RepID=A0AAD9R7T0_ACRCE|nr:Protein yippee-like 2 [Acropora cervicornis]